MHDVQRIITIIDTIYTSLFIIMVLQFTLFDLELLYSRPDRLRSIAERFNLDEEAVLDNVLYARAYTSKIFKYVIYKPVYLCTCRWCGHIILTLYIPENFNKF